jgi:hypothetical protein
MVITVGERRKFADGWKDSEECGKASVINNYPDFGQLSTVNMCSRLRSKFGKTK